MKGVAAFSVVLALPTDIDESQALELYKALEACLVIDLGVLPVESVSGVTIRTKSRRKLAPIKRDRAVPIPNENQQSLL